MEALAEGLEGRSYRAEVLATFAHGSVNLRVVENIDTLGMRAIENQDSAESVIPGVPGCWHVRGETRTPSLNFSSLAIRSLAPGRIVVGHRANDFAQVLWRLRSASLSRLLSPERPERGAMPLRNV
jgi:hypothetical protein